jgi:hypothetical protein
MRLVVVVRAGGVVEEEERKQLSRRARWSEHSKEGGRDGGTEGRWEGGEGTYHRVARTRRERHTRG